MSKSTRFVGLDDSKDSIEVAVAESGRDGEVRRFGLIPNTPAALRKPVRQLGRPKALHFVYESGPIRCRLDGQPEEVQQLSWKAQVRLCGRYRKMRARGKQHNKTVTAIARELVGFL